MRIKAEVSFSVEVYVDIQDDQPANQIANQIEDKIFETARNEINLYEADAMINGYEIDPED